MLCIKNMKILLLGDITGFIDEGMKNITYKIKSELEKNHKVMVVHPRHILRVEVLMKIKSFSPEIIHYMHGPTLRSFLAIKFLSILNPSALTVMSVPKPNISKFVKKFLFFLKPDIFLLQSQKNKNIFMESGAMAHFLYPGVDLSKFQEITESQKILLRNKYGLPPGKLIILHVGHISIQRNLKVFCNIQKKYSDIIQVVIVGALTMNPDKQIAKELENAGCMVWLKHFVNLEEIYQLSDCYIFPGMHLTSAIEIPLSVLEAMACNLPVITDKFGGLPDILQEGDGLSFISNEDELFNVLKEYIDNKKNQVIKTNEKVKEFAWENGCKRLISIYEKYL